MPCRKPTELALAHQIAGLCHAGVAEIGGVGKNRCQDSAGIIMYAARGEMGKAFREAGPTINLRQQVSNADGRQMAIQGRECPFGFLRCDGSKWRYPQLAA